MSKIIYMISSLISFFFLLLSQRYKSEEYKLYFLLNFPHSRETFFYFRVCLNKNKKKSVTFLYAILFINCVVEMVL